MDALTTLVQPIAILLASSVISQNLYWLKAEGILSPVHWAIVLLLSSVALFYLAVHYLGWKDAAVLSLALAIGLGMGIVGAL